MDGTSHKLCCGIVGAAQTQEFFLDNVGRVGWISFLVQIAHSSLHCI